MRLKESFGLLFLFKEVKGAGVGMKLPITVCIPALNEEELIEKAISSVLPVAKEVIVLDTGSADRTIELSKMAGAAVHQIQWSEDFSLVRNKLIELAENPYILMLDADEQYVGDGSDLAAYINSCTLRAGRVKLINQLDHGDRTETFICRIFPNNNRYSYRGRIHEQLMEGKQPAAGINTEIAFVHYGYEKAQIEKKQKTARNINMLMKELNQNPEDPYLMYQIAKTLYVAQEYEKAVDFFKQAAGRLEIEKKKYRYTPNLILFYAYTLLKLKKWVQLENLLAIGIEIYPDFADLYYIYASWIIESKKVEYFHKIPGLYSKCIELGEADSTRYETSKGVGSYKALYNLGLFYEITGDLLGAKECYRTSSQMNYTPAQKRLEWMTNHNM